jgi:hypothetical protein
LLDLEPIAVDRPTTFEPGSRSKVDLFAQRYAAGVALWVDGDTAALVATDELATGRQSERVFRSRLPRAAGSVKYSDSTDNSG